jgi:hypothetical protein
MQTAKSVKPPESPGTDPLTRLIEVLEAEGYTALGDEEEFRDFGERIFRRRESVLFAEGETVFVLKDYPALDEKVLQQAVDSSTNLFRARSGVAKALSVFQSTTVYVCIIARSGTPHNAQLGRFVTTIGGAVIIPVVIVPEINQVVYPTLDEKIGATKTRIEYLQHILGERREPVDLHRQTIRTFWVSMGIVAVIVAVAIIASVL